MDISSEINALSDINFSLLADACMIFTYSSNKLARLDNLNETLVQIENSKEIAKWLIKEISKLLSVDSSQKLAKDVGLLGLNDAKAQILLETMEKHSANVKESLRNHALMISQLVDMQWKFGVTASTNEVDKLGNAFLQLELTLNDGGQLKTEYMELTLKQFYSFLLEMNKAKSQMDYL